MNSMFDAKAIIKMQKKETFDEAKSIEIPIRNLKNIKIGSLVPVGKWILSDEKIVGAISSWRQRAMQMFLVQFQATIENALGYLKNLSIAQEGRIFFLIYDDIDRLVGHIGMAGIDANGGELDNIMRGVNGGDPRLIYFSEITLLDWCFETLGLSYCDLRVISYNWMAISLHEEVGFHVVDKIALRKSEKDGITSHESVKPEESNVRYSCTKMLLTKEAFLNRRFL